MRRKATVYLDDAVDRRRFTCPEGHVRWAARPESFRCLACAEDGDADPVFDELRDPVTGVRWPRERVVVEVGVAAVRGADGWDHPLVEG